MKRWNEKVMIPKFGICEVREVSDEEITEFIPPISHGFVNLYKDGIRVGWCGSNFARKRIIKYESYSTS